MPVEQTTRSDSASQAALLPCPFCGGEAFVDRRSASTAIRCSNDQCIIGDPAPFNDFTHRTDAITAWNARAAIPTKGGGELPDVYWNAEGGNFYDRQTRKGMGQDFYREWYPKRDQFPTSPSAGAGV